MTRYRRLLAIAATSVLLGGCRADPNPSVSSGDASIVRGTLGLRADSIFRAAADDGVAGVALLVQGSEILLRKGYGLANREAALPFTAHTIVDVGSITKQFTAAALVVLEADARLRLTDSLARYFANAPPDKAVITIHQLLTHSSGLPPALGGDYIVMPRDSLVALAFESDLVFPPGQGYSYSNVGYSILGAIIEIVSGMPYERYVHDRLLRPAGVMETGYVVPQWNASRLARGYLDGKDWGSPLEKEWASDGPYWNLKANGGMLSTVDDILAWHWALQDTTILPLSSVRKLERGYVTEPFGGGEPDYLYGYGWAHTWTPTNGRVMWHTGGNPAFLALIARYLDDDVLLVWLTNSKDHGETRLIGRLREGLFR